MAEEPLLDCATDAEELAADGRDVRADHGLPAGLVSPSTMTVYGTRPQLRDVLYIAVSQSGGSPDLVRSIEIAREQGALTLAVTNNPNSALAAAAELHLDVFAGQEQSIAATKSYTAEILTLYLLFDRARGGDGRHARPLPDLGARLLDCDIGGIVQRYRFAQRLIITGRGYSYPTALEAALKLMETCYFSAQAFSGADLLHGPLATVDPQMPVLAIVQEGAGGQAMLPVLSRLAERNADVVAVGPGRALNGRRAEDTGPGVGDVALRVRAGRVDRRVQRRELVGGKDRVAA
jgi:glutamine---fructose-6-phosphate transaminase (isomerizing)